LSELIKKLFFQSVSPALTKTDIIATSGSSPEEVEALFKNSKSLDPDNVALAVEYALSAPPTVNVSSTMLFKEKVSI